MSSCRLVEDPWIPPVLAKTVRTFFRLFEADFIRTFVPLPGAIFIQTIENIAQKKNPIIFFWTFLSCSKKFKKRHKLELQSSSSSSDNTTFLLPESKLCICTKFCIFFPATKKKRKRYLWAISKANFPFYRAKGALSSRMRLEKSNMNCFSWRCRFDLGISAKKTLLAGNMGGALGSRDPLLVRACHSFPSDLE